MAHPLHACVRLIDDLRVAGFACHPIRNDFTGGRSPRQPCGVSPTLIMIPASCLQTVRSHGLKP